MSVALYTWTIIGTASVFLAVGFGAGITCNAAGKFIADWGTDKRRKIESRAWLQDDHKFILDSLKELSYDAPSWLSLRECMDDTHLSFFDPQVGQFSNKEKHKLTGRKWGKIVRDLESHAELRKKKNGGYELAG